MIILHKAYGDYPVGVDLEIAKSILCLRTLNKTKLYQTAKRT